MSDKIELKIYTDKTTSEELKQSVENLSDTKEDKNSDESKSDVLDKNKADEIINKKNTEKITKSPLKNTSDSTFEIDENIKAEKNTREVDNNNRTERKLDNSTSYNIQEVLEINLSSPTNLKRNDEIQKSETNKKQEHQKDSKNTEQIQVETHENEKDKTKSTGSIEKEVKTEKINSKSINPSKEQSIIFQLFNYQFFFETDIL